MKTMVTLILLGTIGGTAHAVESIRYEVEAVKGKVMVRSGESERVARAGDAAHGGDRVATNWRGRAVVAVTERGSRFEIFPSSRVALATNEPGVLVELERGRLKAWFDKLSGVPAERFVKTPGAILAVRGTRYGVEVDARGLTRLTVFAGVVEVQMIDDAAMPAVFVNAGESCEIEQGVAPRVGPMHRGEMEWDRGGSMSGGGRSGMRGGEMAPGMRDGGMSQPGSTGRSGSGSMPHRGGH